MLRCAYMNRTNILPLWGQLAVVCLGLAASTANLHAAKTTRTEWAFPDIHGYVTLKCDFHMHTVFSDGSVWPVIRVQEAWRDGLDAIAITDHIEYKPHKADVSTNTFRSYEIAKGTADTLGVLLVRAAEITRGEPPGHLNVLFLDKIEPLCVKEPADAVKAAAEQGAYIFWNHPGWQQPDNKAVWYKEQGEFYKNGWLRGIEIVNGTDYEDIVHGWAVEKKLTIMGDSDVHAPIDFHYDHTAEGHRPMTLVFAREKTLPALKEALMERRTAVFSSTNLFGDAQFLKPIFDKSVTVKTPTLAIHGKGTARLQVFNSLPFDVVLTSDGKVDDLSLPKSMHLVSGQTAMFEIKSTNASLDATREVNLPYTAVNLVTAPGAGLKVQLPVKVVFTPAAK